MNDKQLKVPGPDHPITVMKMPGRVTVRVAGKVIADTREANYYSIPVGGVRSVNAAWTYEAPPPSVGQISEYLAFYPDRVDEIVDDSRH